MRLLIKSNLGYPKTAIAPRFFQVHGAGFRASLVIPVTRSDTFYRQYPIGDSTQWQKIGESLPRS